MPAVRSLERGANDNRPKWSFKGFRLCGVCERGKERAGFATVTHMFPVQQDARMALSANNHELKRRRIAVTIADTRVKGKDRNVQTETGLGRLEDTLSRSVRVKKLPPGTQEGLLQQVLERHAKVKRVEVFEEINEATVELENISVRPNRRLSMNCG